MRGGDGRVTNGAGVFMTVIRESERRKPSVEQAATLAALPACASVGHEYFNMSLPLSIRCMRRANRLLGVLAP